MTGSRKRQPAGSTPNPGPTVPPSSASSGSRRAIAAATRTIATRSALDARAIVAVLPPFRESPGVVGSLPLRRRCPRPHGMITRWPSHDSSRRRSGRCTSLDRVGRRVGSSSVRSSGSCWSLGALVAFRQAYVDRILPGVQVGGVDVGGLTRAEAHAALVPTWARSRMAPSPSTPRIGWMVIPFATVDRAVDYETMLDSAAAVGRDGTRFAEALTACASSIRPVVHADAGHLRSRPTRGRAGRLGRSRLPPAARRQRRSTTKRRLRAVPGRGRRPRRHEPVAPAIDGGPGRSGDPRRRSALPPTPSRSRRPRAMPMPGAPTDAAERIAAPLYMTRGDKTWKITPTRIRSWITFAGSGAGYGPQIDTALVPEASSTSPST